MARRAGLARIETLIENLKRELALGTTSISCASVTTTTSIETEGTLAVTGNTTLSGNVKGAEGLKSATISATSGTTFDSGAMSIPANSVITELGVVISAAVDLASAGTLVYRAGSSAGADTYAVDATIQGSADPHAVGKGSSSAAADLTAALNGAAPIIITAGQGFSTSARDIHARVTAGQTISSGTLIFWVKYREV